MRYTLASALLLAHAALAAPEYRQVPAKLFRVRDGLGNVFAKLEAGKPVRIAYFGGSITAANGWRPKTLKWFQQRYPKAKIEQIHAAIGGTGSNLGAYRCQQDVLRHKPDLVFVEFAVNDGGASPQNIWRSMEGIVRQIWKADPTIDICYVYTLHLNMIKDYMAGMCPRSTSAMEQLADHYGIPSIDVALRIVQMAQEGKVVYKVQDLTAADKAAGKIGFTRDSCHPTPAGHNIFRDVIADALVQIEKQSKPGPHALKAPFIKDNLEDAKLAPVSESMLTGSWKKLDPTKGLGRRFRKYMPVIWEGATPGDKLAFKFKGTEAKIYDIVGPDGGQVIITVDGKTRPKPRPRFDSYCRYWRLQSFSVASKLPDTVHTVMLEIHPEQPDRSRAMKHEKNPNFDRSKYDGTVVRVGWIMLRGELVE